MYSNRIIYQRVKKTQNIFAHKQQNIFPFFRIFKRILRCATIHSNMCASGSSLSSSFDSPVPLSLSHCRSHSEIFESLDVRVHSPQPCHARLKRDHRDSAWLGSAWLGLAWLGFVWRAQASRDEAKAKRGEARRTADSVLNRGRIVSPLLLRSLALLYRCKNATSSRISTTDNAGRGPQQPFFRPSPFEQWRERLKCLKTRLVLQEQQLSCTFNY